MECSTLTIDLVVKNGKVYTHDGFVEASICIDEGKVVALTKDLMTPEADRTINAVGNFVLPGMIDMHVHFRDPGANEREDFQTGSTAAAAGGVTTVADMPNTVPSVTSLEALEDKKRIIEGKALVDYALVAGAGAVSGNALRAMAEAGVVAFKSFMIARFKELAASDGQMLENFRVISRTGRPCLVHAENEDIVARGRETARALNRHDPIAYPEFRPPIAEVEATMRTILLAADASAHVHICHMTTQGAADVLSWAKAKGIRATGETSPNYLLLTAEVMKKLGPYAKVDPPLRGTNDQRRLWEALRDGTIDALASDHAPYTREEKERGWEDIFEAPSGSVAIETSLPLMLDCVNKEMLSLNRLVEVQSVNPAKILGLYPRKGAIGVGFDADIVVVDMKKRFEIKGEDLHSKQKNTPFEGFNGSGLPRYTIVRGEVVMDDGEVVGNPGYGEFQRPIV